MSASGSSPANRSPSRLHTGDPAGYTLEQLARDLGAALAALDVERCDLLGHSMGGMLAQRVARADPGRIASLVLLSTSAEPLPWVDQRPVVFHRVRSSCYARG